MGQARRSSWALLALVAALAGCSGDDDTAGETAPNIVQPGAPGEPTRTLAPEELAELPPTPHTEADVRFMHDMIHHHAQALRMTALVPTRSRLRDLELLAQRIERSQDAEIEQMERWLAARDAEVHDHEHRLMPGMLTEAQLKRLAAARGAAFDRLFLRSMIRHHRGALTMVSTLIESGSGAEPELAVFTGHVEADQELEIIRMQELLDRLEDAE